MAMTEKQQRFVDAYLVDPNAKLAAKLAGYADPGRQGWQVLNYPEVKAALSARQGALRAKADLDAAWVLDRLKLISDRCIQGEPVLDSQGAQTGEWKFEPAAATRATELIGKHIGMFREKVEVTGKDGGPLEVEVSDARQRLAERLQRSRPRPDPCSDG